MTDSPKDTDPMTASMDVPKASLFARTDDRPILVSVLGGGWFLMGCFGILNAVVLIAGGVDGFQFGAQDTQAQLAAAAPEFVDESTHQWLSQKAERLATTRRFGWPLLVLAGLSCFGGIRLLRGAAWSRATLLATGIGVMTCSTLYALKLKEISMRSAADIVVPPDVNEAMLLTALLQVLIQSLPIIVAIGLLRHPVVRAFVQSRARSTV